MKLSCFRKPPRAELFEIPERASFVNRGQWMFRAFGRDVEAKKKVPLLQGLWERARQDSNLRPLDS
jgi:hypothetical protein